MKKPLLTNYRLAKYRERIKLVLECCPDVNKYKYWYSDHNEICQYHASQLGINVKVFIGVVAALSPCCAWVDNVSQAVKLLQGRETSYTTYKANVVKALQIKQGAEPLDVLGGFKVRAFYENLLEPEKNERVCIDSHILNMLHDRILTDAEKHDFFRSGRYQLIEGLFKRCSAEWNMRGHELQAVLWITWKGLINSRTSGVIEEPF